MGKELRIELNPLEAYEKYEKLNLMLNCLAFFAGIDDLGRYYIPTRQIEKHIEKGNLRRLEDGTVKIVEGKESELWEESGKPRLFELSAEDMMAQAAFSLQNNGRKSKSIGLDKPAGENAGKTREDVVKNILCNYSPKKILKKFDKEEGGGAEALYNDLFKLYKESGWISEETARNHEAKSWSGDPEKRNGQSHTDLGMYARGLLGMAEYLSKEEDNVKVNVKMINEAVRNAPNWELPGILQEGVKGFGPALARDFLKECGCLWLAKPDTHIVKMVRPLTGWSGDEEKLAKDKKGADFSRLMFKFSESVRGGYHCAEDSEPEQSKVRIWDRADSISAYKIDKMIWLICTGGFYLDIPSGEDDAEERTSRRGVLASYLNSRSGVGDSASISERGKATLLRYLNEV